MENQTEEKTPQFVAFRGQERVGLGDLAEVAAGIRERMDGGDPSLILIFDVEDGRQVDIDLDASVEELRRRHAREPAAPEVARGRGRPRLGVVGREVTLLPRHWQWLQSQRAGPSATLRRLVDDARRASRSSDRVRQAQDAIHRFISATAGDLAGFEEATRALYRGNRERFEAETSTWPRDVRDQMRTWAEAAFPPPDATYRVAQNRTNVG